MSRMSLPVGVAVALRHRDPPAIRNNAWTWRFGHDDDERIAMVKPTRVVRRAETVRDGNLAADDTALLNSAPAEWSRGWA